MKASSTTSKYSVTYKRSMQVNAAGALGSALWLTRVQAAAIFSAEKMRLELACSEATRPLHNMAQAPSSLKFHHVMLSMVQQ
jgi:hypothetical protein